MVVCIVSPWVSVRRSTDCTPRPGLRRPHAASRSSALSSAPRSRRRCAGTETGPRATWPSPSAPPSTSGFSSVPPEALRQIGPSGFLYRVDCALYVEVANGVELLADRRLLQVLRQVVPPLLVLLLYFEQCVQRGFGRFRCLDPSLAATLGLRHRVSLLGYLVRPREPRNARRPARRWVALLSLSPQG